LFSFLSLSASVDSRSGQAAASGPLGPTVTFIFEPALSVPAGGAAVLTLSAGMVGASQAAGGPGRPGSTISGGGRGAGQLAAVLGLINLGLIGLGLIGPGLILVPGSNRRRMRLFSAMFMLIAATQLGCGGDNSGDNNGVAVLGTSQQSVPACGVGVGSANGAVGVAGLPATLGQIRLVE
jgi:hypothetical protein